jgi:hypothetical protein
VPKSPFNLKNQHHHFSLLTTLHATLIILEAEGEVSNDFPPHFMNKLLLPSSLDFNYQNLLKSTLQLVHAFLSNGFSQYGARIG